MYDTAFIWRLVLLRAISCTYIHTRDEETLSGAIWLRMASFELEKEIEENLHPVLLARKIYLKKSIK